MSLARYQRRQYRFAPVQRVLGLLLMIFSFTMLPPVVVSFIFTDGTAGHFLIGFAISLLFGMAVWWGVRRNRDELKLRDGFLVVSLFWVVLGLFGAIPLFLAAVPKLTVSQAVFESISGLTTTGATVIAGLDTLPKAILYYRQQLQWLGGMGIIVLAVAILPMLGVGGMQLYRAETPGPVKDSKLTPRIKETARALWLTYVGLTVACGLAYWGAGMTAFDAIAHSFSTVAIGGFSTHDLSMGYFNSTLIESIAVVFMLLAATNFSLHFLAWQRKDITLYFKDPEWKVFFLGLLAITLVCSSVLYFSGTYPVMFDALATSAFQTVSVATTTGFTTADYSVWPLFLPVLLLLASFVGGCAYSTAGGMKVVRLILLFKQGIRQVHLMVHPQAQMTVKLGNKSVPDPVVQAVWGFFSAYMGFYVILLILLLATGLDPITGFAAVAACINNLGPGLGEVSSNFSSLSSFGLWVCTFAMLLGRLELFPLLVLMTPAYWRR